MGFFLLAFPAILTQITFDTNDGGEGPLWPYTLLLLAIPLSVWMFDWSLMLGVIFGLFALANWMLRFWYAGPRILFRWFVLRNPKAFDQFKDGVILMTSHF